MNDASAQLFAIALTTTWCGFGLYGVLRKIERSPQARERLERFRRARLSTKAAFVAGLIRSTKDLIAEAVQELDEEVI